ncbi:hypothetical protein CTAYLR_006754 [Chrysophaeum taylorii]|uniref:Rab-GAP TBC domain-containing protein n=1 Tax=Chrysophaeum taylorii TaxID=2483200 RepID=A0AAD7XMX1_9STRA|nr:hypothetical protein CTAYLR_006754 [Chrysophaeum taylorii]
MVDNNNKNNDNNKVFDPWGFFRLEMAWYEIPTSEKTLERQEALDRKRDRKWAAMTHHAGGLEVFCAKASRKKKLKERVRKGVPRAWRRAIWPALLEVSVKPERSQARGAASYRAEAAREGITYAALCKKTAGDPPRDSVRDVIERDLCRTYPKHRLFETKTESTGVASLRRVLRAYAEFDPQTEYCQGMNYVAALLIIHVCGEDSIDAARRSVNDPTRSITRMRSREHLLTLDGSAEEDAFWLFVAALKAPRTRLRDLYGPGMPGSREALSVFDALLADSHPALHAHMRRENCFPDMFATHWIVTVFSAQFPFALVARVWDQFFLEGWKPVYRVAVAILAAYEKDLRAKDFESLMTFLRDLPDRVDVDRVFSLASKLNIKTHTIDKLERQFKLPPDDDDRHHPAPR